MSAQLTSLLQHSEWMHRLARDLVRDPDLADDLVQEAWVAAVRHPPAAQAARAWFRRVLTNAAHQHRRREAGRYQSLEVEPRQEAEDSADLLERAELWNDVSSTVLKLREPYRSTILRRYFDGWMPERIAQEEGVPVSTVKTRLQRGLAELRRDLDQRHGGRAQWAGLFLPWLPDGDGPAGAAGSSATPTAFSESAAGLASRSLLLAPLGGALGLIVWATVAAGGASELPTKALDPHMAESPRQPLALQPESTVRVAGATQVDDVETSPSVVSAALLPSVGWRGEVRGPDGQPVAGARVWLDAGDRVDLPVTTTDLQGRYELCLPGDLDSIFELHSEKVGGFIAMEGSSLRVCASVDLAGERVVVSGTPDGLERIDFQLEPAHALVVTALDSITGAPIPGIELSAAPVGTPSLLAFAPNWYGEASTDAQGRATLIVGRHELTLLQAEASASYGEAAEVFVVDDGHPFELRVPPHAHVVTLEAIDRTNQQSVPTATFFGYAEELAELGQGYEYTLSRSEHPGPQRLVVAAPGYAPRTVAVEGQSDRLKVALDPLEDFAIEFRRGSEPWTAGGELRWRWHDLPEELGGEVALGSDGRVVVPLALRDSESGLRGHPSALFDVTLPGREFLSFTTCCPFEDRGAGPVLIFDLVEDLTPLKLRVVDGQGQGVRGVKVTVFTLPSHRSHGRIFAQREIEVVSGEDGRAITAVGLPTDQDYELYACWGEQGRMLEPSDLLEEIELKIGDPSTRLRGQLLDEQGRPAWEVSRFLSCLELRGLSGQEDDWVFARIDSEGHFEANDVGPGVYEVLTPGFEDVLLQAGEEPLRIAAPEPYRWRLYLYDEETGGACRWEGSGTVTIETDHGKPHHVSLQGDAPFALPVLPEPPTAMLVDLPGYDPLRWAAATDAAGERDRSLALFLRHR